MVNKANRVNRKISSDDIKREVEEEFTNEFGSDAPIDIALEEPESLEDEIGLEEVYLDEQALDSIPTDDTDDNLDADDDGIEDGIDDAEIISDLPQEETQSYGTGLQGQPSDRTGRYSRRQPDLLAEPDYTLTGGDVDADYDDADAVGEEAVGGTVATPDQDIVEDLAAAAGIQTDDRSFLRTNDMLEERDDRRWELDPKSSEDYGQRRE